MTPTGKLQTVEAAPLALPAGNALPALPARQGLWIGTQVTAAAIVGAVGLWAIQPELALSAALGAGAGAVNPRKLWALPVSTVLVGVAGMLCAANGISAVIGAGAAAGAIATWLMPHKTDAWDSLNGALATLTGASLGLWAATALLPASLPTVFTAMFTSAIVALMASQGLLPAAFRFDSGPELPTPREIKNALQLRYRPPVHHALDLYDKARPHAPDRDTKRGLAEVAMWVFRLQQTRQTLEGEAESIDPLAIHARIERFEHGDSDEDEFTRERRMATAAHLRRLLEHRGSLDVEIRRNEALVDYALAFLEEARAGLAIARELPGETMPERLDEVLGRLRSHAKDGDVRRATAREVQSF